MVGISLFTLLLTKYITAENPGCNYAATGTHFYPIGACDTTKEVTDTETIYSAFEFVCYGNNEVYKLEYNGADYCDGEVVTSTKYSDLLLHFECDSHLCGYASGCSTTGCVVNGNCTECKTNRDDYSRHCLPVITDHCLGNSGEVLKYDVCSAGLLTENFFFGSDCNDSYSLFHQKSGGFDDSTNCFDNAFYTAKCITPLLTPNCNYAATNVHFYPIDACDKSKRVDEGGVSEYSAFKYVCNGEDVYKNTYNTDKYCSGPPISSVKQNDILKSFECDLSNCGYADGCSRTECVVDGDCTECKCKKDKVKGKKCENDFNEHCLPIITGHCMGNKGELLYDAVCDDNDNLLTEYFYWGDDCINALWNDESGSDDESINCKSNAFHVVNCLPNKKESAVSVGILNSVSDILIENHTYFVLFGYSVRFADLLLFCGAIFATLSLYICCRCILCPNNSGRKVVENYNDAEEGKLLF